MICKNYLFYWTLQNVQIMISVIRIVKPITTHFCIRKFHSLKKLSIGAFPADSKLPDMSLWTAHVETIIKFIIWNHRDILIKDEKIFCIIKKKNWHFEKVIWKIWEDTFRSRVINLFSYSLEILPTSAYDKKAPQHTEVAVYRFS